MGAGLRQASLRSRYHRIRSLWRPCPRHKLSVLQVLAALEHLHSCGVLHRDLKLSNMFLGRDGTVKVGDLGLACHLPSPAARRHSTCGSLNWMAPEVLRPGPAGYGMEVSAAAGDSAWGKAGEARISMQCAV